jgi:hypothetical protein
VLEWWTSLTETFGIPKKRIRSLIVLVVWELWNERNARVCRHREASNISLLNEIKGEAEAWFMAVRGALHLSLVE